MENMEDLINGIALVVTALIVVIILMRIKINKMSKRLIHQEAQINLLVKSTGTIGDLSTLNNELLESHSKRLELIASSMDTLGKMVDIVAKK